MIRHTVVFNLKYDSGSLEERQFLDAASELSQLPGVLDFEVLRQVSQKSDFEYGLAMTFESQKMYDAYNVHPNHVRFVKTHWASSVVKFLEMDFQPYHIP